MFRLSNRLKTIANMVIPCACAADIGTDHAYVPVWLCQNGVVEKCIASDISKGSAKKAADNVAANGLCDKIDVRCGGGTDTLTSADGVQCLIIAGMGGMLMLDILYACKINVAQLVLQPQKDITAVRKALHKLHFVIKDENIVFEDGKYYTIISALPGDEAPYSETEYLFGKKLIERKDAVLKRYILQEIKTYRNIMQKANENRKKELSEKIEIYRGVVECL